MDVNGTPDVNAYTPEYGSPISTTAVTSAGNDSGFAASLEAAGGGDYVHAQSW